MRLNFIIEPNYFIAHTLAGMEAFSSDEGRADVVAFQNYAWSVSEELYNLLARPKPTEQLIVASGSLRSYWERFDWKVLDAYITTLTHSSEYTKIYEQAQEYLSFCKKQWKDNFPRTSLIIKELTGLELEDTFTIYITHPSQRNGTSFGDHKIGWGHHEDWPHYAVVYLWHEILHTYIGANDLEHAVIQLISDEELRVRLNGGMYPPFVGHGYLMPTTEKILPAWKRYLQQEERDIHQFIASLE